MLSEIVTSTDAEGASSSSSADEPEAAEPAEGAQEPSPRVGTECGAGSEPQSTPKSADAALEGGIDVEVHSTKKADGATRSPPEGNGPHVSRDGGPPASDGQDIHSSSRSETEERPRESKVHSDVAQACVEFPNQSVEDSLEAGAGAVVTLEVAMDSLALA